MITGIDSRYFINLSTVPLTLEASSSNCIQFLKAVDTKQSIFSYFPLAVCILQNSYKNSSIPVLRRSKIFICPFGVSIRTTLHVFYEFYEIKYVLVSIYYQIFSFPVRQINSFSKKYILVVS